MSRLRITVSVALGAALISAAACSDDDERPPPPGPTVTSSSSSSSGGTGGDAGAGGDGVGGGSAGAGGIAAGGAGGAGGAGDVENCFDGIDNDGDVLVDCADGDCLTACSATCPNAVPLADPSLLVPGDNSGHPNEISGSCVAPSGREVVYEVTAAQTGMLDVAMDSDADLAISVRTTCNDNNTEQECINRLSTPYVGRELLKTPITAGDTVYVVVEGEMVPDEGAYVLDVESRPIVCGDGFTDLPGEMCDDGGVVPGDGCSATCQVESTESEPANNTIAGADTWSQPYYGSISPAGDVDVVAFNVPPGGNLLAEVFGIGDGCAGFLLDSYIEMLDTDGSTVLNFSDDSMTSFCSAVYMAGLAGGTYYLRVSAPSKANPAVFGYTLELTLVP